MKNSKVFRQALFILFLISLGTGLQAQKKGFGVGIIFGEPTGLSMKYWMDDNSAIDAAAAWSFQGDGYFHLHADYLQHFNLFKPGNNEMPIYIGLGAKVRFQSDFNLGIRLPIGAEFLFFDVPIGIFAEFVPILDLLPATEFDFNFGAGARFYF